MAKKKILGKSRKPDMRPDKSGLINFLEYYDEKTTDKARDEFMQDYYDSRDWRTSYKSDWIGYYQMYRSYNQFYEERPDWQASYFVPKCFEIVETIMPRVMGALYDMPPLWIAMPESPDMRKASRIVEKLLDTRAHQTKLFMSHYESFKEMLIYGTAFQKLRYDVTSTYEGPRWYPKDLFDMYPDPRFAEIEDMRFICDRTLLHIDDLREMHDEGKIVLPDDLPPSGGNNWFSPFDRLRNIGMGDGDYSGKKEYHEVIERYGRWKDVDTNEVFDVVSVIVDRRYMVRFEETSFYVHDEKQDYHYAVKPYIKFVDVPVPGETYGIGEIEVAEYLNLEMNDRRNMQMDAMQFALSPTYQVIRAGIEDMDRIIFAPGQLIPTNYVGADPLKPVQKDMAWTAAYQDISHMNQELRDATGIQKGMSGSEGDIRKTAAEAISLVQESNQRTKMKIQIAEIGPLAEQARLTYLMDKQYTDEEVLLKVYNSEDVRAYAKVTPSEIEWRGDFKLQVAAQFGQKAVHANNLLQFIEVSSSIPGIEERIDFNVLLKRLSEAFEIQDKDLIIEKKEEEPEPQIPEGPPQLTALPGGAGLPPGMGGATTMAPGEAEIAAAMQELQAAGPPLPALPATARPIF